MTRALALATALLLPIGTALAGYEASSFKREDRLGKNYWNAASALDSNLETCWRIHGEQKNEGSWIAIDTPTGEVDKIAMVIGWAKDEETFKDFARVKTARVELMNAGTDGGAILGEATISFEDKMGWQIIDVLDTKVGGEIFGGRVKITVTEVYPGKDFPSLAVSEVRVHLKEFPAVSLGFGATVPSSETDGHSGDMMMDDNARTFWAASADTATFSVKAPGYGLSSLGIQSGPKTHGRPKTVKVMANQVEVVQVLEDKPGEMQWLLLPALVGYTGGAWGDVQVEIVDSYPGESGGVAISEVKLNAASIEEF